MAGKKLKPPSAVRFNGYAILQKAVQSGIEKGWQRAHKHVDQPARDDVVRYVEDAVMLELEEVLEFDWK